MLCLVIRQTQMYTTNNNMTDRELLEQIYRLLLEISEKVKEIDNDDKQLSMNILANLIADGLIKDK